MAATYEIDLNLKPGGIPQRVHLNQYDKGQKITVHLYNDNTIYTPVGTVWVSGTKKDNTGFQYQCEKSGSSAVITVTDQMTCYPGDTEVEVTDVKEGVKQGSANFILSVENAAFHDDTVISETDIPAVQIVAENIGKTEDWKNQAAASATAAKTSETNAKASETNAKASETNSKKSEEAVEKAIVTNGYAHLYINQSDGHLMLFRTDEAQKHLDFSLAGHKNLMITMIS